MLSERQVREFMDVQRDSLEHGWAEPGGYLLPSEPDAEERQRVRERLAVQVYTLMRVLEVPRVELDAFAERWRLAG